MGLADHIAYRRSTFLSNIIQLGSEQANLILDKTVDLSCVALGVCLCVSMLVGVYRAAEWGSKLRRQHDRRVNRALESRRRRPQSHIQSSPGFQLPTSFTFWIASTVVAINTIGIFYMCFQMLVVPSVADSMQALHHHANTLTLPPSHQPTHPQWFEPTRRDHVHWMEDLASSVSSTITASRDFWTLKPHTHISNNDKVPTAPLQSSAASLAWPKSMFSDMCYAAAPDRPSKIDTLMRFEPADMCMDAVWHSTSAAAAAAEAGHLASNSPSIRLHYTVTQPSVPARNVSAPAVAVMLTRPDHTTATVPDTAVALYTPIADMGMCAANFMPAAVVFPTATAAGQSTFDTSEASTAVALYYTTPLFMPWANIFWPVINSGSTTVVTLLLSDSSVESCFNYKQDTAAAPELPMPAEPLTSNAMSVILPQLQSSFHRNAAGQEIVHQYPRPETPCSTSPDVTVNYASGRTESSFMEHFCPSLKQLAYLALLLLLLAGLRRIAALLKCAMKQSVYTREWEVSLFSKKIRWSIHMVDS